MDLNELGQKSFQEFTHQALIFCHDPAIASVASAPTLNDFKGVFHGSRNVLYPRKCREN